jgi:hypothetical protein
MSEGLTEEMASMIRTRPEADRAGPSVRTYVAPWREISKG